MLKNAYRGISESSIVDHGLLNCITHKHLAKQEAISIAEERTANALREILSESYKHYKHRIDISAMVAHYRGIQVLSQKKTAFYSNKKFPGVVINCKNRLSDFHEALLRCYEASQNNSNYTLNSILTEKVCSLIPDNSNETFSTIKLSLKSILRENGSLLIIVEQDNYKEEYLIDCSICNRLLKGRKDSQEFNPLLNFAQLLSKKEDLSLLLTKIDSLNKLQEKLNCDKYKGNNITTNKEIRSQAIEICLAIKNRNIELQDKIRKLVNISTNIGNVRDPITCLCEELKSTLQATTHSVVAAYWRGLQEVEYLNKLQRYFLPEKQHTDQSPNNSLSVYNAFFPILRMLQGILFYHKFYGNYIICSGIASGHNRRIGSASWLTIHPNEQKDRKDVNILHHNIGMAIGESQHSIVQKMLGLVSAPVQNTQNIALNKVFRDDTIVNDIDDTIGNKTNISIKHLCSFVRLAEILRPQAVHESRPLEITIVLGTQFHRDLFFKDKKIFYNEYHENCRMQEVKLGDIYLELLPLNIEEVKDIGDMLPVHYMEYANIADGKKIATMIDKHLSLCCARIKGQSAEMTGPGNLMFVDYTKKILVIDAIVAQRHSKGIREYASLRELTGDKNSTDMLIIRIVGRKRIELLHDGKCLLSWDDNGAKWKKPAAWDEKSIKTAIQKLFRLKSTKQDKRIDVLCNVIMQISDAPREGASFVLTNESIDKYLGSLTENTRWNNAESDRYTSFSESALRSMAIQDGGTVINLRKNRILFRKQFLPFGEQYVPTAKNIKPTTRVLHEAKPFDIFNFQIEGIKLCDMWNYDNEKNLLRWEEWPSVLHWGTRHRSALGMSACLPESLCICISEDGPIQVFQCGRALNPKINEMRIIRPKDLKILHTWGKTK